MDEPKAMSTPVIDVLDEIDHLGRYANELATGDLPRVVDLMPIIVVSALDDLAARVCELTGDAETPEGFKRFRDRLHDMPSNHAPKLTDVETALAVLYNWFLNDQMSRLTARFDEKPDSL